MWTCSSGAAEDCLEGDLLDPDVRTLQGDPVCINCARATGMLTDHDRDGRRDVPFGLTD